MDIVGLIKKHISKRLNSLETVQVVTVESVDYTSMRCSVRPKTKATISGTAKDRPIILNVPIAFQKSGDSVILLPPTVGDVGVVIFSKFALDHLLINPDTVEITIPRTFSINDAMYVGGLYLDTDTLPTIAEGEMLLHHHSGTEIRFTNDGKIYITDGSS